MSSIEPATHVALSGARKAALVSRAAFLLYLFFRMNMTPYENKNGDSGVSHYAIGKDYIRIQFKGHSSVYTYSDDLSGKKHIDAMKMLAQAGKGLGTYISQHPEVRDHFVKSERS